jgi:hypothetical protein
MDKIVKNNEWFIKNHHNLYSKYPNEYVVIVDKKVVKNFVNLEDAFTFAYSNYRAGEFIIRNCSKKIILNTINTNIEILGLWKKR